MAPARKSNSIHEAEKRGFTRGVAWAIALASHHQVDAGLLLKESGLTYEDFKADGVVSDDLRCIRRVVKMEGME